MTKDPATWKQGQLLQEVYRLKGFNDELLHLCKWTLSVLDSEKWDTSLQAELRLAIKKGA